MDDIYINPANGLNWAWYLKGKFPSFKITFFTIPGRSTQDWMLRLSNIPWIELAMHGYNHDEEEEVTDGQLKEWGLFFPKIYKGPNWKVTKKEKGLLKQQGYFLVTKSWLKLPDIFHGHTWIEADWKNLESKLDKNTQYKFISEVI